VKEFGNAIECGIMRNFSYLVLWNNCAHN